MYTNHISLFGDMMDKAFKAYADDGCLENYSRPRYDRFRVGKKDSAYLWSALDGAMKLWNQEHPKAQLCFEDDEVTEEYDEYSIGYWEDVCGINA